MRITVNGQVVTPVDGRLLVLVDTVPDGGTLKSVEFRVSGGPLHITGLGREAALVLRHEQLIVLGERLESAAARGLAVTGPVVEG